jgi:hypothetical protein
MVASSSRVRRPLAESRPPGRFRRLVAAIEIAVGIGAIYGGYGLLSDAEGLGAKRAWLDGSVFSDYTVPGLILLAVIGGGMLLAASVTLLAGRWAPLAAGVMAVVLALWGVIETATIGWRGVAQLLLVAVFVAAPAVALGAFALRAARRRESA